MSGMSRPAVVLLLLAAGAAVAVAVLALRPEVDLLPDEEEVVVAPLTGEPVDEALEHAIVATKVGNTAEARPQAGLEDADVVYEVLVEGGITRFLALYHSEIPDDVGPVRSARLVDIDLLPAYGPLLAISGARAEVLEALADRVAVVTETGPPAFSRVEDRAAPHNLFVHPREVLDAIDDPPAPPDEPVWEFTEEPPAGGTDADELAVELSPSSETGWRFDEERGTYERLQNGALHEPVGPSRLEAANVIVVGAAVEPLAEQLVSIEVVGEGPAILLRDGQRYDARWHKAAPDEHLEVRRDDGEPLPLRPGPTWIVVPPVENLPTS